MSNVVLDHEIGFLNEELGDILRDMEDRAEMMNTRKEENRFESALDLFSQCKGLEQELLALRDEAMEEKGRSQGYLEYPDNPEAVVTIDADKLQSIAGRWDEIGQLIPLARWSLPESSANTVMALEILINQLVVDLNYALTLHLRAHAHRDYSEILKEAKYYLVQSVDVRNDADSIPLALHRVIPMTSSNAVLTVFPSNTSFDLGPMETPISFDLSGSIPYSGEVEIQATITGDFLYYDTLFRGVSFFEIPTER